MQRVFFMESLEHWPIAKCEKSCNRPYRSRKFVHSIKHFCNSLLESLTVKQWHLNELIFTSDEITRLEFWLNVWFFSFERVHRSCHDFEWKWNRQCHSHGTRTCSFWAFAAADDLVFVVLRSDLHYSIKSSIKHFFFH